MAHFGAVMGGVALLTIAFFVYIIPINDQGYSIPKINDLCGSAIGSLAQLFERVFGSTQITQKCEEIRYMTYGIYGIGLIGLILLIVGALIPSKRSAYICGYCNFVTDTELNLRIHYDTHHQNV